MSNEFDKEVAAKIADRAISEARKESKEKYGKSLVEQHTISFEDIKFKPLFTITDNTWDEPQTNNLPKKEMTNKLHNPIETRWHSFDLPLPNNAESGDLLIRTMKPITWEFHESDIVFLDEQSKESKEMSKIDFYRQKVQQYEAVENLMESIEYEINNAQDSQILLKSDYYSDDDVLYHTYQNMIDAYKKCYGILEEVLKDI